MMHSPYIMVATALIMLAGCAPPHSQWDDIDYSSVYKKAQENDPNYTPPIQSVVGCVDDDLYNCNPKGK